MLNATKIFPSHAPTLDLLNHPTPHLSGFNNMTCSNDTSAHPGSHLAQSANVRSSAIFNPFSSITALSWLMRSFMHRRNVSATSCLNWSAPRVCSSSAPMSSKCRASCNNKKVQGKGRSSLVCGVRGAGLKSSSSPQAQSGGKKQYIRMGIQANNSHDSTP